MNLDTTKMSNAAKAELAQRKRAEAARACALLELAFDQLPDRTFERTNRTDDLDHDQPWAERASLAQPGSGLKMALAAAVNASTWLDKGQRRVRQDGSEYFHTIIERDWWAGDGNQSQGGEVLHVTVQISEPGGSVAYYVVSCSKKRLNIRSEAHRELWRQLKGSQTMRVTSWIYEPNEYVRLGEVDRIHADDATQAAWQWFRESVDQDERAGSKIAASWEFEVAEALDAPKSREANVADWDRWATNLSYDQLEAVMRVRLADARVALNRVKRDKTERAVRLDLLEEARRSGDPEAIYNAEVAAGVYGPQ